MNELLPILEKAINELEDYSQSVNLTDNTAEKKIMSVLIELRKRIIDNTEINKRLLCAVLDVAVYSVKNYDDISFGQRIAQVNKWLYENTVDYRNVEPLGSDFGKGDPF